jgi:ATP-binding cassette subfamily F protein 3
VSSADVTRSVLSTTADPVDSPYPPPFSSLYFAAASGSSASEANKTVPSSAHPQETPPAFSSLPPLQGSSSSSAAAHYSVVADTKAALPRDTKEGSSGKDIDDGEPPPPYSEGSSPLDSFTYVMATAGGPASIITQVQQGGGGAPISNLASGENKVVLRKAYSTLTL